MKTWPAFTSMALAAALLAGCSGDSGTDPESLECTGGADLAVGQTVNGTLEQGDDLDIDGAFLDRYALEVAQGGTIEITMRSSDVDAFVWLLTESEGLIEADDDSGGGSDAQISQSLDRGCYLVDATTFEGESGEYELSVLR